MLTHLVLAGHGYSQIFKTVELLSEINTAFLWTWRRNAICKGLDELSAHLRFTWTSVFRVPMILKSFLKLTVSLVACKWEDTE